MLTQIGLQTGLHVAVPLLKPLKHPLEKLALVLETSGQVVHVCVGRLPFEPYLGVRSARSGCVSVDSLFLSWCLAAPMILIGKRNQSSPYHMLDPAAVKAQ